MVNPKVGPGPRNLITDVDGLMVGNAQDERVRSGVTVVLPDSPAVMAVDARGGAPGTRDIAALDPANTIDAFHGLVLSGGSVFGLDAAGGVTSALSARGVGLALGPVAVPVVPAAILFDLANGGDKAWGQDPPYRELGRDAVNAAALDFPLGNVGAGYGAQAGAIKGGLGSASAITSDGLQVGALVAVNSSGSVLMPDGVTPWAWALEQDREFGGLKPPETTVSMALDLPKGGFLARNTTIAVVATNLKLTKSEAKRLAIMAQDGLARAIRPVHTPFDGDLVFAMSTRSYSAGEAAALALARAGALGADCLARAVVRGVLAAQTVGQLMGYADPARR
ncbi:MAG: peptidase T4 [Alphaproteobacteria bacterium]|nr:MAG: peptidase T4 [Alphaproteobacteria bacterium]